MGRGISLRPLLSNHCLIDILDDAMIRQRRTLTFLQEIPLTQAAFKHNWKPKISGLHSIEPS